MITIYDSTQWAKIPNRNVNNETKRPWQNVNSLIFSYIFFLWAITIQYIHWLRISKLFVYFFARVNLPIVDIAAKIRKNGILLPKLFWPTVGKNCSSDREKLLKFEAEGREFAKFLRSLEEFIQTVKGQNRSWIRMIY